MERHRPSRGHRPFRRHTTTFAYDDGNIETATEPDGVVSEWLDNDSTTWSRRAFPRDRRRVDGGRGRPAWLVDTHHGLLEHTDRSGNATLYTPEAVFLDRGTGVTVERHDLGRIAAIVLEDGERIAYRDDAASDRVEVVDQAGNVAEFHYDEAHRLVAYNDAGRPALAEVALGGNTRRSADQVRIHRCVREPVRVSG